jgi:hypothetical protein
MGLLGFLAFANCASMMLVLILSPKRYLKPTISSFKGKI